MVVAANEEKTKCRENTRAKAHAQAQQRHAQTSAGHSSTRGPRKHLHAVAGARYLPTQAGWQTHKRRQSTRRQVQSNYKNFTHFHIHTRNGRASVTERSVGIKSRLVAEDLESFSNLPGAQPVSVPLAAERVGSCHVRWTTRPGETRPTRTVDDGPNERSVSIRSRFVADDLVLFLNLPGTQPVSTPLAAERVGSCHLRSTFDAFQSSQKELGIFKPL